MRLIVLPGLDGTGVLTAPVGACLRRSHEVEFISYPVTLTRYDEIARWLAPQLEHGDYVLIAESFSGPLAVRIAATKPRGLKALVVVASFARSPRRVPAFLALALYMLPLRSARLIRLAQGFLVGKWGKTTFPVDFVDMLRGIPRSTLVGRLRSVIEVDVSASLPKIAVRKLFVSASGDRLVPRSRRHDFAAAGWRVADLEGPHFLTFTRPQVVADEIECFLNGHL